MTRLRLAREYLAPPIFCSDSDKMGHCDLEDLPITDELRLALKNWDDKYQSTFNDEYPPDSGFNNQEVEKIHTEEGMKLAERLQAELGDNYSVEYEV